MDNWLMLCYVLFGCITGVVVSAAVGKLEDDLLCSGIPAVVRTADTIRTFSCAVELKLNESK